MLCYSPQCGQINYHYCIITSSYCGNPEHLRMKITFNYTWSTIKRLTKVNLQNLLFLNQSFLFLRLYIVSYALINYLVRKRKKPLSWGRGWSQYWSRSKSEEQIRRARKPWTIQGLPMIPQGHSQRLEKAIHLHYLSKKIDRKNIFITSKTHLNKNV